MKRCVFCFSALLLTLAFAIALELGSTKQETDRFSIAEDDRHLGLKAEADPEVLVSPEIQHQKSPEKLP